MQDDQRNSRDEQTKRIAGLGLFLAFALILGYVEALLPVSFGIPGVKLGLANLAVLFVLYLRGIRDACIIDVLRILLSGFLFGNLYSILYSMAGGLLSFLVMVLLKKSGSFSIVGVSVAGGVFHNLGQLAVAVLVVETIGIFYYVPPLLLAGVLTGFLIGFLAKQLLDRAGQLAER